MKRLIYLLILFIFLTLNLQAQRVGLVLSGGAAKGLAHVGVLKALEENNIPIDYITGTSMGGLVGGMYAAGYSASEMEYIATSKDFQEWVSGNFEADFTYYYERKAVSAAIISLGLGLDSIFQARLRSNLINDIPLNFALLELTAQASINSNWNFDSLMIPYRCMIADVFSQQQIAVKNGSLGEAMRATMTVPYVFRPIKINGRYVFDGGLYNNFPVDVMRTDFNPDVIIGVNVSSKTFKEYPFKNDEEAISKFITPTLSEVLAYFEEHKYKKTEAEKAFNFYNNRNWNDSNNRPVKNWKLKMQEVWFKEENKIKIQAPIIPTFYY